MKKKNPKIQEGMTFSIANWDACQHYKHRNPPWIKFYNSLLDDQNFYFLKPKPKLLYILLLLFASKSDNSLTLNYHFLSSKTGFQVTEDIIKPLFETGFLLARRKHGASLKVASSKQNAISEKSITEKNRTEQRTSEKKSFISNNQEEELEEKRSGTIRNLKNENDGFSSIGSTPSEYIQKIRNKYVPEGQ
jgi:hypothetical protein